jgi:hypothetical protein
VPRRTTLSDRNGCGAWKNSSARSRQQVKLRRLMATVPGCQAKRKLFQPGRKRRIQFPRRHGCMFSNNISCFYPEDVRGEGYLAAGQGNAAAAEFQKILDPSGLANTCWTGASAHLGVARARRLAVENRAGLGCRCRGRRLSRAWGSLGRRCPDVGDGRQRCRDRHAEQKRSVCRTPRP